jgi:hypothetical protein
MLNNRAAYAGLEALEDKVWASYYHNSQNAAANEITL